MDLDKVDLIMLGKPVVLKCPHSLVHHPVLCMTLCGFQTVPGIEFRIYM